MLGEIVVRTRAERPVIHCITNYVTANDCANILLACGASPIMADALEEAAEITAQCNGLVLNLGTPNPRKLQAMLLAGREANRQGIPVILDPVGAGCSEFRRAAVRKLTEEIRFAAVRGNAAEIAVLASGAAAQRGLDAERAVGGAAEENAARLAQRLGATVIVTGDSDVVTDGKTAYRVLNGHPVMRAITGAGCQLSALAGAYAAANPDCPLEAALAAVCAMGLCGETAHGRLGAGDGNATCRNYIIDAVYHLTPEAIGKGARYEIIR